MRVSGNESSVHITKSKKSSELCFRLRWLGFSKIYLLCLFKFLLAGFNHVHELVPFFPLPLASYKPEGFMSILWVHSRDDLTFQKFWFLMACCEVENLFAVRADLCRS